MLIVVSCLSMLILFSREMLFGIYSMKKRHLCNIINTICHYCDKNSIIMTIISLF